jgi:hypothetical protein
MSEVVSLLGVPNSMAVFPIGDQEARTGNQLVRMAAQFNSASAKRLS